MAFQKGQSGNPAGRPRKAEKYAGQISAAEDQIADRLPQLVANLLTLATGGWESVDEEWLPARLVEIGQGENRVLAFPEKPADELVLVKRRRSIAAPDRKANEYLLDRILGRPTATVEAEIDTPEDSRLSQFLLAIEKAYGGNE